MLDQLLVRLKNGILTENMVSALAKGWIPEGFFPTSPGGMKPFLEQGQNWLEKK
jgi:hypothetical protein